MTLDLILTLVVPFLGFVFVMYAAQRVFSLVHRWYERNPLSRPAWLMEYLRSVATGEAVPERPGGRRI